LRADQRWRDARPDLVTPSYCGCDRVSLLMGNVLSPAGRSSGSNVGECAAPAGRRACRDVPPRCRRDPQLLGTEPGWPGGHDPWARQPHGAPGRSVWRVSRPVCGVRWARSSTGQ
jgi:hypothetical protein